MKTETMTMRDAFIEQITCGMAEDKRIFFLSADLGSPKLDRLRKEFPDRFLNVGIAEQNLINVATGLALEGFVVYAYAIAPFLSMRACEQLRTNLSLMGQIKEVNVNLIGVGAGLSYDLSGPTHHCLEDLSIIRTLPNITLFSPSDWVLVEKFFGYSLKVKGAKYLRFDSKPLLPIYRDRKDLEIEKGFYELARGKKVCLVSTGYMTHKALRVAERLRKEGSVVGVIDLFLLKPLKEDLLAKSLQEYRHVVTLEEGFINAGGMDSLLSNVIERFGLKVSLKRLGFKEKHVFEIGSREHLHRLNHLDEGTIATKIKECR